MKTKPIISCAQANRDVEKAVAYHLQDGAKTVALSFVDTLEQAYAQISRHPASGSVHYAHELNLPGLRFWPLKRYPQLVFYVESDSHIDVWRVLHGKRDIPAWLQGESNK